MKRDGADSEVEGGRFKLRILERGNTDLHGLVRSDLAQEISETGVRLNGDQGISAEIKQSAGRPAGPRANFEHRRAGAEAAPGVESLLHPFRVVRTCAVVGGRIKPEGPAADLLGDLGSRHDLIIYLTMRDYPTP